MKIVLIAIIKFYQKYISVFLPPACIYSPSCSEYSRLSIQKYGAFKGTWIGLKRIIRCNPFFPGGLDEVK